MTTISSSPVWVIVFYLSLQDGEYLQLPQSISVDQMRSFHQVLQSKLDGLRSSSGNAHAAAPAVPSTPPSAAPAAVPSTPPTVAAAPPPQNQQQAVQSNFVSLNLKKKKKRWVSYLFSCACFYMRHMIFCLNLVRTIPADAVGPYTTRPPSH